ncbi:MAG: hypothetical protein HW402_1099 [Dehalococcoidales bacterium]|nr:hypothetical protein [Dehalococcoidales bacterium]
MKKRKRATALLDTPAKSLLSPFTKGRSILSCQHKASISPFEKEPVPCLTREGLRGILYCFSLTSIPPSLDKGTGALSIAGALPHVVFARSEATRQSGWGKSPAPNPDCFAFRLESEWSRNDQ